MKHLTPTWSWTHSRVALVFLAALIGAAMSAWQASVSFAVLVAMFFAGTVVIGLSLDALVGSVVGLVAAAGLAFVREALGLWDVPGAPTTGLAEAVLLVAAGALAGWGGRDLHRDGAAPLPPFDQKRGKQREDPDEGVVHSGTALRREAMHDSLGVLKADLGAVRLEEEVARARLHRRPLALIWLLIRFRGGASGGGHAASGETKKRVRRAVVRAVEAVLRSTDVPFAYDEDCLVLVLPETEKEEAQALSAHLFEAVDEATFVPATFVPEPGSKERAPLSDYVRVRCSAAAFERGEEAAELVDLAEALNNSRANNALPEGKSYAENRREGAPRGETDQQKTGRAAARSTSFASDDGSATPREKTSREGRERG